MRGVAALSWALVALVVPLAQADVENRGRSYDVESLSRVQVWVNLTLTTPESSLARAEADADDDATVDAQEVREYEQYLRDEHDEALREPQFTLDGHAPSRQHTTSVTVRGLGGATAQQGPLDYDFAYEATFDETNDSADGHAFQRGENAADAGPVTFRVGPPFVLLEGLGIRDWSINGEGTQVEGTQTGSSRLEIRFVPSDQLADDFDGFRAVDDDPRRPGGASSAGPVYFAVSVVGAAAWALRRRSCS